VCSGASSSKQGKRRGVPSSSKAATTGWNPIR
jgi:hypothetical protein